MPSSDQAFYERALRRIQWLILILGIGGALILGTWKGIRFGGGFLLGAAASYLSLWRWQRVAASLGSAPPRRTAWFVLRILALLAIGYAIIRFSGVNHAAVLAGLLVAAAAATAEMIYELIYGT